MPDFGHTQREVVGQEKPSSVKELRRLQRQIKELERRLTKEKQARAATAARLKAEVKAVAVGAIGIDITERKRAENMLRESEDRLKRAQEIARIGHFVWDGVKDEVRTRAGTNESLGRS